MSHRESMSNADAAWLHMDRPTNLMQITSALWFDEPLDLDRLADVIRRRLVERFPRFTQCVVERPLPLGTPQWEDDPTFDLASHLHHIALPAPGDKASLEQLVGDLMATPLDRSKPLWQIHLVDGYGDGCALVVRMHHCIADGIALARVMLSLTDEDPDAGIAPPSERAERGGRTNPLAAVARPALAAVSRTRSLTGAVVHEGLEVLAHPAHTLELAALVRDDAAALAKLLLTGADAQTAFKGEMGVAQRVAWSEPIPLTDVKAVGHRTGTTVNDVLLTAVAGALRRYLKGRGEAVDELRAIVPFNLRPLDEPLPRELGNRFGLVFLPLPVGIADPRQRLAAVARQMGEIKNSQEGTVSYSVLSAMGMTPVQIEQVVIDLFSAKGTAVMTNVPGPSATVYLAGVPMRGVLVWAPCSGSVSMSVSIFSYDGDVTVGFAVDAGLIPDPDAIATAFGDEFAALERGRRGRARAGAGSRRSGGGGAA